MAQLALLIDFGSTFTKLTAVDLAAAAIIGKAAAPTTVREDITIGLQHALAGLEAITGAREYDVKLAASSAAGGLKLVAVGLVPELTLEAAKRAALGAGANLTGAFAYELSVAEVARIEALSPDVLLLCGGTDGGNREVVTHNAEALAASRVSAPFIYAGNKAVADRCRHLLERGGKEVAVTANVMPSLGELSVDEVREAIRAVFIERIVQAKGLDQARRFVGSILMPTPTAVLRAATLLADGTPAEAGLGELLVVDVGGATTDVHSVGQGAVFPDAVLKGVPEPYAKRTVEGDLGVRHNAPAILAAVGESALKAYGCPAQDVAAAAHDLAAHPERLPLDEAGQALDTALATAAVAVAVGRHAGSVEILPLPFGAARIQRGKNLMDFRAVIGTGGPIISNPRPQMLLAGAVHDPADPLVLKPRRPRLYLDSHYSLYAIGLLAETYPDIALRVAKRYLKELTSSAEATDKS